MQSVDWATGCLCSVSGSSSLTKIFSDRSSGFQPCVACSAKGTSGISSKYSKRRGISISDWNFELLLLYSIVELVGTKGGIGSGLMVNGISSSSLVSWRAMTLR